MMLQLSKDSCSFYYCTSLSNMTSDMLKIVAQKDKLDLNLYENKSYIVPAICWEVSGYFAVARIFNCCSLLDQIVPLTWLKLLQLIVYTETWDHFEWAASITTGAPWSDFWVVSLAFLPLFLPTSWTSNVIGDLANLLAWWNISSVIVHVMLEELNAMTCFLVGGWTCITATCVISACKHTCY